MTKRVVITGIGWVTPMGADIESVWAGLLAGKSAIGPTTHFDASTFPTKFCGQVADSYTHNDHVTHKHLHEGVGANTSFA
ncbi:MAG TPA: hypothetical protein DER01_06085, partial [Phycisphaerales bacterium]|nr:hypothetical protein [Phycisphaerales bacterium]